jgi:hypothetical protein
LERREEHALAKRQGNHREIDTANSETQKREGDTQQSSSDGAADYRQRPSQTEADDQYPASVGAGAEKRGVPKR